MKDIYKKILHDKNYFTETRAMNKFAAEEILTYPNKTAQFSLSMVVEDFIKVVINKMPISLVEDRVKLAQELH